MNIYFITYDVGWGDRSTAIVIAENEQDAWKMLKDRFPSVPKLGKCRVTANPIKSGLLYFED